MLTVACMLAEIVALLLGEERGRGEEGRGGERRGAGAGAGAYRGWGGGGGGGGGQRVTPCGLFFFY